MNLLFLCTGNSCRSQMAEGWAEHLAPEEGFVIRSAGLEAHGKNPRAIAVMAEVGIDITGQESVRVDTPMLTAADMVVTVCGHADEHCPVLLPGTRKEHWPLEDPAQATGSNDEVMAVFRASRDEIHRRVQDLMERLVAEQRARYPYPQAEER